MVRLFLLLLQQDFSCSYGRGGANVYESCEIVVIPLPLHYLKFIVSMVHILHDDNIIMVDYSKPNNFPLVLLVFS